MSLTLTDAGLLSPSLQQTLLKRRISRILIEHYYGYWGHDINTTQYFIGLGLMHYAIVRNARPKRVLCVGSKQGFIPAILALACKDNGIGHVDFVDAGYDEDNPVHHWGGTGFWKKNDPEAHFARLGIKHNITVHIMTTREYADNHKKTYQYIYLDGDHSYSGARQDYEIFWPLLDKNGFMALHDISMKGNLNKGKYGVWKLWKEIGMHGISFPNDSGLGIIQK